MYTYIYIYRYLYTDAFIAIVTKNEWVLQLCMGRAIRTFQALSYILLSVWYIYIYICIYLEACCRKYTCPYFNLFRSLRREPIQIYVGHNRFNGSNVGLITRQLHQIQHQRGESPTATRWKWRLRRTEGFFRSSEDWIRIIPRVFRLQKLPEDLPENRGKIRRKR